MNLDETLAVIQGANVIDPRVEVSKETARMWHRLIGDLAADDVVAALEKHYRNTRERVMPADIRALVNGAPDAGRIARGITYPVEGVGKPANFDQQVAYWRQKAAESGRHCHCPHHGPGWGDQ